MRKKEEEDQAKYNLEEVNQELQDFGGLSVQPAAHRASAECPSGWIVTTITVSRSEISGTLPSSQSSGVQTVSQYNMEDLICEGPELCFEEVRARKYFEKIRAKQADEGA